MIKKIYCFIFQHFIRTENSDKRIEKLMSTMSFHAVHGIIGQLFSLN